MRRWRSRRRRTSRSTRLGLASSTVYRVRLASYFFSVLSDALSEGVLVLMDPFLARRTELRRVWPEVFKPDSDAASSTARSNGSAAT